MAFKTEDLRNFAIVGHGSSGKTMLGEAILSCGGVINRMGSTLNGSTVSDYHEEEKKRQISIHTSLLHIEWLGKKLNFADTPGYLDFLSDGLGALQVSDSALIVVHAGQGVEVGTSKMWDFTKRQGISRILIINALDKENTDFEAILKSVRERFGKKVFPMTIPINPGLGFNQALDVLRRKVITYQADGSGKYSESDPSGQWAERAEKLHQELIEYVAESDDSLLEKFFDEGGLSEEEMRSGMHEAIKNESFIPLFSTAGEANIGVGRLLDFIARFGHSPLDHGEAVAHDSNEAEVAIGLKNPNPVVQVFKTVSEAHVGDLSYFRIFSGTIRNGLELYNSAHSLTERVGQIFILNGNERTNVDVLHGGDIGAFVKLKNTHTGDTLCDSKRALDLPRVDYPNPNIHGALVLKSKGDEDKIATGLATLHKEDPAFQYRADPEIRQTILSGQGELHLQVILDELKRRFHVEIELIEPKIPFRETIRTRGEAKYRHKKQTGGAGQFAEVWMRIEPKPRDTGMEFTNSLVGQNVDRVFVPSVGKGVQSACSEGILAGYRVVDIKIDFYDGKMHSVDSKDVAFQIAGKQAFREAFLSAQPYLLEPIYNIEIQVPEENLGDVMGDISSRRGRIQGMDSKDGFQIVKAQVPQMEIYRYSTTLRSLTGGRGIHSEEFSHYEQMQRDLERKVIERSKRGKEE